MGARERSKVGHGRIYVALWKVVEEGRGGEVNECVFVCDVQYYNT
jgi:hypothetical protein